MLNCVGNDPPYSSQVSHLVIKIISTNSELNNSDSLLKFKYTIVFITVDMLPVTVPFSNSGGARYFLGSVVAQSGTEAKPAFCQIGTGSFFLGSKLPRHNTDYHSHRT